MKKRLLRILVTFIIVLVPSVVTGRAKFPVDQAVSLVVPLEEAPNALWSWSESPANFRKILVMD